jgi:hypothetical protein
MNELKLVVNNKPQWDAMLDEINSRIQFAYRQLEQFDDLVEIYRIQGEVRALRSLTKLRDKINGG